MKKIMIFLVYIFLSPANAAPIGDDGLHKPDWLRFTFNDMVEDFDEARSEGKRLIIMFEQRGCIYCTKMHEDVFPNAEINKILSEEYFVVQMNLFGDNEVIDFNGNVMSEKEIAKVWGVVFTPTLMFMPENIDTTKSASQNAIITMPGAFGKYTTKNLLNYVLEKGYESGEHFQKYHARKFAEQKK